MKIKKQAISRRVHLVAIILWEVGFQDRLESLKCSHSFKRETIPNGGVTEEQMKPIEFLSSDVNNWEEGNTSRRKKLTQLARQSATQTGINR